MIMYAPSFAAGTQLVCMQMLFNQAHASRGPMNYACNCFCGQSTNKQRMKPHCRQDPKVIMHATFFGAGAQLVCMQMPFQPGLKSLCN